jgi:hypothetical protein
VCAQTYLARTCYLTTQDATPDGSIPVNNRTSTSAPDFHLELLFQVIGCPRFPFMHAAILRFCAFWLFGANDPQTRKNDYASRFAEMKKMRILWAWYKTSRRPPVTSHAQRLSGFSRHQVGSPNTKGRTYVRSRSHKKRRGPMTREARASVSSDGGTQGRAHNSN